MTTIDTLTALKGFSALDKAAPISLPIIKTFMLAGKANFTLRSTKLDKRYTYLITRDKKRNDRYFAKVLFGPDNYRDYRYIGLFYVNHDRGTIGTLLTSSAAHLPHTAPQFVMLQYFLRVVANEFPWPPTCEFYPSGKCAVCGRKLTTPESINRGIGPECYNSVKGGKYYEN